jgi:hypothetical protein
MGDSVGNSQVDRLAAVENRRPYCHGYNVPID